MAITRVWQAGAEVDTTNSHSIELDYHGGNFLASAVQKKTGSYSYKIGNYSYALKGLPATRQIRLGLHVYPPVTGQSNACLVSFGTIGLWTITVRYGLLLKVSGVEQDRDEFCLTDDVWSHVGLDLNIDPSTGWAKVYVDGIEVMSFTGNTGNADGSTMQFGTHWNGALDWYIDNIFVDDTTGEGAAAVVPDLRFEYITPSGDGNYSQLDGSDGNQVNNYLQVDEQPHDSDTTYNEAQAADEKDSYAMTTIALDPGWTVNAIIPCALAKKTDGGVASQAALMTREDGVDEEGSAQDLGTDYGLVSERFAADPAAAPWDQTSLDAVEVGVCAKGTF